MTTQPPTPTPFRTGPAPGVEEIVLWKYEGAGNDFLVVEDRQGDRPLLADEVRRLCDRRHGVGADGVLRLSPGTGAAALSMELRNADGSPAEMSGNGIRCLVHAAVDHRWVGPGPVTVATAAGLRTVELSFPGEPGVAVGHVDMGQPRVDPGDQVHVSPDLLVELDALLAGAGTTGGFRAGPRRCDPPALAQVDMGNPHLVVLVPRIDPAVVAGWGAAVDAATPGGTNVELVRIRNRGEVEMGVWERGAGVTPACGTGSCAAAVACWAWGLVDDPVVVHNPGGPLTVGRRGSSVVLGGPSRRVASVHVDRRFVSAAMATVVP